jgi:hypothetical protein
MSHKPILAVILVLALVTMACGVNITLPKINLPITQVKTGPIVTDNITVALPKDTSTTTDLTLAFGAGDMILAPGAKEALVTGTATYNVADFKPEIKTEGHHVSIQQGRLNINGIPSFQGNVKNEWNLMLSDSPIKLHINSGAYVGKYEFGGLSLEDLEISDGAAQVNLSFDSPNKIAMDTLNYQTGASSVTLTGLNNANFSDMTFRSGAGTYTLEFSGELKRNADVSIESGMSTVTIIVPEGVAAQVFFEGGLANINVSAGWQHNGNEYTQPGNGPKLTIHIKMAAGNVELHNR